MIAGVERPMDHMQNERFIAEHVANDNSVRIFFFSRRLFYNAGW